jgi:predicted DsbA family dithiol-disulfide isomerase
VVVLILHFDYTLPRAALALLRLERLAAAGHRVGFRGIDVLGVDIALPVTLDQLVELAAVRDELGTLGLDVQRPQLRPPTLAAHLVGDLAERQGQGSAWRAACLSAYWSRGADLSEHATLVELGRSCGLAADEVRAVLGDVAARNELRASMLALRALGIGGVPVLEFDGTLIPADLEDDALIELVQA